MWQVEALRQLTAAPDIFSITVLRSEDPEGTNTFYSPSTTTKASIFVLSKELDFGYTLVITLLVRLFIYFFGRCNLYDLSLIFRNWKIFNQ